MSSTLAAVIFIGSLVLALAWRFAAPLWICLAVSAALLIWLQGATDLRRDNRTALADLVLLTPLVALAFSWR